MEHLKNWEDRIRRLVGHAAEAAIAKAKELAASGIDVNFRLFIRPATATQDGELLLCEANQAPAGFVLATGDPFHGGIPYERYFAWIRLRIGLLPLLATS